MSDVESKKVNFVAPAAPAAPATKDTKKGPQRIFIRNYLTLSEAEKQELINRGYCIPTHCCQTCFYSFSKQCHCPKCKSPSVPFDLNAADVDLVNKLSLCLTNDARKIQQKATKVVPTVVVPTVVAPTEVEQPKVAQPKVAPAPTVEKPIFKRQVIDLFKDNPTVVCFTIGSTVNFYKVGKDGQLFVANPRPGVPVIANFTEEEKSFLIIKNNMTVLYTRSAQGHWFPVAPKK